MTTTHAPIKYFGGKGGMLTKLFSYFPPTGTYEIFVDAYGGSGVVTLNVASPVKIYNDLNRNAYTLMCVLADPSLFERFRQRAELMLYDEETSREYRLSLRGDIADPVERAVRFWYVTRTRQGAGSGGFSVNPDVRMGMSKSNRDLLASIEGLPDLHRRLRQVIVCNRDALALIADFDRPNVLIYADPPYAHETRTDHRYETDADDAHHEALARALSEIKAARVVLSGYDNSIYAAHLRGFVQHSFTVNTVRGTGINATPKQKTECVWTNFAPHPVQGVLL